ncbi:MAG: phage tail tape measure protein [Spirochaetota bacterium]
MAGVTAFVQANGIDFGTGADIATDIGTAFGYGAGELGEVLDVLTLGANSANTDIAMLGETMKYAAADAHSLGLSLQETTAMAGILANAGIKGSMAGTTLKETVKSLAVPDDKAKEVLERLKIKVYDEQGRRRDLTTLLREVNEATQGLSQEQKAADIQAIFKERGARGILTLMSQGQDAFEEFLAALQSSAAGTVKRMQDIMAESLAAGLAGINSRKEALFTTITESGRKQLVGIQLRCAGLSFRS